MSLPVRRNMTLGSLEGGDSSKSGSFEVLSLELLFKIAESDLGLADVLAVASANKDLFAKLIGRLFEQGMHANKRPLQWACTKHACGPATLEAMIQLHPRGRQLLSAYFEHDDEAKVLGQTPLIVAIRAANVRVVRLLLKYGADANQPERNSSLKSISYGMPALWAPIHFAVGYDLVLKGPDRLGGGNPPRLREQVVQSLLQNGAVDIGKHTKSIDPCAAMSALFLHVTNGSSNIRAAIIRQLLQHGAEGNRPSLYRVHWIPEATRMVSPLSLLIAKCRRKKHVPDEVLVVVPLLISAGDGSGRRTTSGAPLIMDCLNPCENMSWVQLAEMLLSSRRQTARAVHTQGEPVVVWLTIRLLDYELWFGYNHLYATKMEKQNQYDRVRSCTYRMLQLLLHHGADINARCPENHSEYPGATALIVAARIRDEFHDVFLDLLESGANAKARDSKGRTALFGLFAGRLSNPNDRIQALSEAGTPMNAADKDGDTVLHYAARYARRDFSNWLPKLLAHGCDLGKKNKQGETFVDVLCKDVRPSDLEATRSRILEGIQQAKQDAAKVKRLEKLEKYRMNLATKAEEEQERREAAGTAQVATEAGLSTAPAATPSQGCPARDVRINTASATHKPVQGGSGTLRPYAAAAQTSVGAAQAGPRAAQAFPGAAPSSRDNRPPGFW